MKAFAILLLGPSLGALVGFVVGVVALPADANFASNGGHAAAGDGFLILMFVLASFIVSVPMSILTAVGEFKKRHLASED